MATDNTLAERLRRLRAQAGLTQTELARAAGLSPNGVRQVEQGRRENPRRDTLLALARALGCGLGELAGE